MLMTVLAIFMVVLLLIALVSKASDKQYSNFKKEYSEFLNNNEGLEIFCYTNREKFVNVIEKQLIPSLDKSVHVVKLVGKDVETNLDHRYISHALYNIKNIGFPNVMKIVGGEVQDLSIHKDVYSSINNNNIALLTELVEEKLALLRAEV